jgi:DNA invertase Pin-like site-specific DNA recombinase
MKKAVIMCRVSSEEQTKGYSLDVQFDALNNYCVRNEIRVLKHFKEDHSAKDFNRPQWKNFMVYAKRNKAEIDLLLITSWDRFSRNLTDALITLRQLDAMGISVQAIQQPIDMSIPENKAMLAMYLSIPEIDNDRKSIKVKEGMRAAQKEGRWSRRAPYGYRNSRDLNNKPLIVPNDDAKTIKLIFEWYAKGKTQAEIHEQTKSLGLKASKNQISYILRSVVYMGKIKVPKNAYEPETIVEGKHKGIVSEKLFEKVQSILNEKRLISKFPLKVSHKEELPLRGMMQCRSCGKPHTGSASRSRNGSRYFYYHCQYCKKERFRAEKVNNTLFDGLEGLKFNQDAEVLYQQIVKTLFDDSSESNEVLIKNKTKKLASISVKVQKIQELLLDDKISAEDYGEMSDSLKIERLKYQNELRELKAQNTDYHSWIKNGINFINNLPERLTDCDFKEKQKIIGSIFPEKLQFDGKKVRTAFFNEALFHFLSIDKGCSIIKKGQLNKNIKLSYKAPLVGLEPNSNNFFRDLKKLQD